MENKKTFSKIGFIFLLFSVGSYVFQWMTLGILYIFQITNYDIQITLSTLTLYVVGVVVFFFSQKVLPKCYTPEKKSLSVLSLLKAFCMCYTLLIFSNLLGTFLTGVIGALKGTPVVNPVEDLVLDMSMPVMFILTVVLAPVFEELVFRKFLIDRTIPFGEVLSILLSGGMFGLFHGNLSQFPYAFALGCFFAYIYIRTGRIGYSILLHAIVNFFGSIVATFVLNRFDYDKILLYEAFVYILVIIGFILWIKNSKKIYFHITEKQIPKNKVFKTSVVNVGMLLYIAFWGVNILLATFT